MSYYTHGFSESTSLPADYAILSHFRERAQQNNHLDTWPSPVDEVAEDLLADNFARHRQRSQSMSIVPEPSPNTWVHSQRPDTFSRPRPSEITPLLSPEVPRIHEESGSPSGEATRSMYWQELKILSKYSLPVFGTHLLEYSLVMASVVSIGHLGTTPLAAITLGTMTSNVTAFSILQGMVSALDTVLPSAWTSAEPRMVGLWTQRMAVVQAMILIPICVVWMNAEGILLALKQDPEVARLASLYLRWVSLGLPAYSFNLCIRRYLQAQGLFFVPTQIIMVVAPINVLLNYLLVWGPSRIRLGYIGAPIATAISLNLVSLASVTYAAFFLSKTAWYPISRRMFTNLGVVVSLGVGGIGQTATEWWAWELVALAASLLGPAVLAAQSILLTSASTTFQAPFALSVATSVRIGNLLGEQNARRAGVASNASMILALGIAIVWSIMFMIFKDTWGRLFNDDPDVVKLVATVIPLLALFQVADGISAITGGILRARGKQLIGALLSLSAYYVIGLPLGILLAFKAGMGIFGLWVGLTVSLTYAATLGTWLCFRTDWDHEVQNVLARFEQDRKRLTQEQRYADDTNDGNDSV